MPGKYKITNYQGTDTPEKISRADDTAVALFVWRTTKEEAELMLAGLNRLEQLELALASIQHGGDDREACRRLSAQALEKLP